MSVGNTIKVSTTEHLQKFLRTAQTEKTPVSLYRKGAVLKRKFQHGPLFVFLALFGQKKRGESL